MYTVIFGRSACPYCVRAKQIAQKLKEAKEDFDYRYIDIHQEGISKADLAKTVGKPVLTVPQVFVDKLHIGGCNEFEAYARQNLGL
jgi:glutaredoxin 1